MVMTDRDPPVFHASWKFPGEKHEFSKYSGLSLGLNFMKARLTVLCRLCKINIPRYM